MLDLTSTDACGYRHVIVSPLLFNLSETKEKRRNHVSMTTTPPTLTVRKMAANNCLQPVVQGLGWYIHSVQKRVSLTRSDCRINHWRVAGLSKSSDLRYIRYGDTFPAFDVKPHEQKTIHEVHLHFYRGVIP